MTERPAISLRDLRFGYDEGQPLLDIEALDIERGERVLLTGESGGGKSTLLGLVAGVLAAQPGMVSVLGTDLGRLSAGERDRFRGADIGFVFQLFNLIPYLSVADNIALPCRLSRRRRERITEPSMALAVAAIAERLGIQGLLDRPVTQLSVGQQQRVAAARALIGGPELVLADEPTSALDLAHRDRFLDLLFECCASGGTTLLFVSHDRSLTGRFDRELRLAEINRAHATLESLGSARGASTAGVA